MKKIISLSLLSILLLSSCSIDWNDEKAKKITKLEEQIKNDTFKKKEECLKNKDKMLSQALELASIQGISNIDEIFYSKKFNTCYYTSKGTNGYILFDYFNNKFLDSANYNNTEDYLRLQNKIKELKGE